jgi:adenine-specific DNA-methyltransferase
MPDPFYDTQTSVYDDQTACNAGDTQPGGMNAMTSIPVNRIVCGDCLSVLPTLPEESAQFVLTDPPYLARYQSRDGRRVPNDDHNAWLKPAFAAIYRVLARDSFCVSFYGWHKADQFLQAYRAVGFRVAGHFVFPKRYASGTRFVRYQHECAYLLIKGNPSMPDKPVSDVLAWQYTGNKLHPTQKPLSALLPLVQAFSRPGDLVLDPFAGSGSTLVAAQRLGRRFFGIELDAGYHAIAEGRLQPLSAAGTGHGT